MFWFNRYSQTKKITTKSLVSIIAIFLTLLIGLAHAESGKLELEVLPASVELPSTGKEVQTIVVVRNPTEEVLYNVHLSTFSDTGVAIKDNEQHLDSLTSTAEFAWNIKLSQQQHDLVSGSVYFRVDYAYRKEKNGQLIPRVLIKSLEVKSRKISPIEQIAGIEVKTTLKSLNENRPGIAHLIIKNKSDVSIQIKDVLPTGPNFICFQNNCSDDSKEQTQDDNIFLKPLSPHKTLVIPIQIIAKDRVQPGKHLLLFNVLIEWREAGQIQKDHLIVTQEVDVGVLGESEILKLLGLPSFLLLPGFLIITTIGLLWNLGFLRLKSDIDKFPLEVNTPEFWLISITLSGLVAFGYILTGRNYLESYGLRDIANVWLFSVFALGLGVYLLTMLGRNLYISGRMPSEKDKPITILKKLSRQKRRVYLERVDLEIIRGQTKHVFLLEPPGSSRDKLWVGPYILMEWLDEEIEKRDLQLYILPIIWLLRLHHSCIAGILFLRRSQTQKKIDELQKKIAHQLNSNGNPRTLATLLEEGIKKKCLQVRWKPINSLNKPKEVKAEKLQTKASKDVIVEQDI